MLNTASTLPLKVALQLEGLRGRIVCTDQNLELSRRVMGDPLDKFWCFLQKEFCLKNEKTFEEMRVGVCIFCVTCLVGTPASQKSCMIVQCGPIGPHSFFIM